MMNRGTIATNGLKRPQKGGKNCGDEAWLLCGVVEKPTDDPLAMFRHNG
jgi:hypothetical protein